MDLTLKNGIVTEYDDFMLWVEQLEENASSYVINKNEDDEASSAISAEVRKVVARSDYDSEEEYSDAVEELEGEGFDTCAEFVTDDGIFYVGVEWVDEEQPVDSFEMDDDVYYC
ncbi:MAG: hypothetical protein J5825_02180 [Lachnospiraceae bacterium]|nr:hypothetical protein [Lachnospiraceae bacterium]